MSFKKILAILIALSFLGLAAAAGLVLFVSSRLPQMIKVEDYEPLLVTQVYDRNNKKIGEFYREKRILIPYKEIPEMVAQTFVAAEDDSFFEHSGINYLAILRSTIENIKAGRKKQGGSTITMQVARSLLLSSEKTYIRKIKEIILSYRMESNLSKENILYLYLNQIYLGQGAYGIAAASDIYFRKPVKDLTLAEASLLAGLPQAPSRYSPIHNPLRAKDRQHYVLGRMKAIGKITEAQMKAALAEPVKIYVKQNYKDAAPFFLETLRQLLVKKVGEEMVLDKGLKIYTSLDLDKQVVAQEEVRSGLRDLDKREGFRGAKKNLANPDDVAAFLKESRDQLWDDVSPVRILRPDGTIEDKGPLNLTGKDAKGNKLGNLPSYLKIGQIVDGVVTKVDDKLGVVYVRFAESKGMIDLETMKWARKPDPNVTPDADPLKKPSDALQKGDVIEIKIAANTFSSDRINKDLAAAKKKAGKKYQPPADLPDFKEYAELQLEQRPQAEAALISFDQRTSDVIAMVGGYDFEKSEFNRAIQAARQTGSIFKSMVYASALDKNFTPATPILDAPIVFDEEDSEGQESTWKPSNHGNKFVGDILFRNALIRSLNVPTVKIIENVGVNWVAEYSKRLGIFSPLNMDFTLALGSSSVTLYEMTKVFATIGRLGKRIKPIVIHKVVDLKGQNVLEQVSLDERFEKEISAIDENFENRRKAYLEAKAQAPNPEEFKSKEPPIFFEDPDQLIRPQTAFVTTTLLQAVIDETGGTGGRARALGRPSAGKTGSTNGYYDGWFVGYTPDIVTGVWTGFDQEKSLGRGEVGGRTALPIWVEYMKMAHEGLPERGFTTPEGIVFANIDNTTGKLASPSSKLVVRQAFIEGTEPQSTAGENITPDEQKDFYKEDMSE